MRGAHLAPTLLLVLLLALGMAVHAADPKSSETEAPLTSELRCAVCETTTSMLVEKAGARARRSEESVAALLDDPAAICSVSHFEKGHAKIDKSTGELTHQQFRYPPPEMKRGCEDFLGNGEDALTEALLGEGGDSAERIVKRVCYEETLSCAGHGGVTKLPPKKTKGAGSMDAPKGDPKAQKQAAPTSTEPTMMGEKERDALRVHRRNPDKEISAQEQGKLNQRLLRASSQREDLEEIKRALEEGAQIDVVADMQGGRTALMGACLAGNANAVKLLLANGADYKIGEQDGYTCLHGAGFQGRAKVAEVAVAAGLPINDAHRDGYMPLHRATWGGEKRHAETITAMIQGGADVHAAAMGMTPLMLVLRGRTINLHSLKALLKAGADANALSPEGKTPLGMVMMGGPGDKDRMSAAKLLVKYGANLDVADQAAGQTVREIADSFGYLDTLLEALEKTKSKGKKEDL